jgi:hypothetical protein
VVLQKDATVTVEVVADATVDARTPAVRVVVARWKANFSLPKTRFNALLRAPKRWRWPRAAR